MSWLSEAHSDWHAANRSNPHAVCPLDCTDMPEPEGYNPCWHPHALYRSSVETEFGGQSFTMWTLICEDCGAHEYNVSPPTWDD